jgi:hypothetical protein
MRGNALVHDAICGAFVAAVVLATAPVWRFWVLASIRRLTCSCSPRFAEGRYAS